MTGQSAGLRDLRVAEYPGPIALHDASEIARHIESTVLNQIIDGLTRAQSAPIHANARVSDPGEIVYTGTTGQIAEHFREQGWSDGLPIVEPTRERVDAFLRFTSLAEDAPVAVLPSANLQATPQNIAVNGVMAGCKPHHMPILLAAVEALGDERCSLNNLGSSSAILPYMLINGPRAQELGLTSGAQLINRGFNPVLGRALGLIVRNIAGFRPGANYMGTFGYQLALALAEDEAASPWEPFHVEQGFAATASTVTIGVTNNWGPCPGAASTAEVSAHDAVLQLLSREITTKARLYNFPAIGPDAEHVMITILMSPSVARMLAEAGYSKQAVKQRLYENTFIALRDFGWNLEHVSVMRTTLREKVRQGIYPADFAGSPDTKVRLLASPDLLHIVVCGDPHRNRIMVLEGGHTRPTTREIKHN